MSALEIPMPQFAGDRLNSLTSCRFCRCTETTSCSIAIVADHAGMVRLAREQEEADQVLACSWYLPGVCNAPACVEKLIAEWRESPEIVDAYGERTG